MRVDAGSEACWWLSFGVCLALAVDGPEATLPRVDQLIEDGAISAGFLSCLRVAVKRSRSRSADSSVGWEVTRGSYLRHEVSFVN